MEPECRPSAEQMCFDHQALRGVIRKELSQRLCIIPYSIVCVLAYLLSQISYLLTHFAVYAFIL